MDIPPFYTLDICLIPKNAVREIGYRNRIVHWPTIAQTIIHVFNYRHRNTVVNNHLHCVTRVEEKFCIRRRIYMLIEAIKFSKKHNSKAYCLDCSISISNKATKECGIVNSEIIRIIDSENRQIVVPVIGFTKQSARYCKSVQKIGH